MPSKVVVRVPSITRHGASYDIEQHGDQLTCSCPAFSFGKKREDAGACKHLDVYAAALLALDRCMQAHGTAVDTLCKQCLVSLMARMSRKIRKNYKLKTSRVP